MSTASAARRTRSACASSPATTETRCACSPRTTRRSSPERLPARTLRHPRVPISFAVQMPVFIEVPATTAAKDLVHVTWADEWRPVLERFGEACATMPPAERVRHLQPGMDGYEE